MKLFKLPMPLWAPEGEGAGGAGDGNAAPDAESVLFPDDNKPTDPPAGDQGKADDNADNGAADWKEYESDPSKTDEENAAAKAEHDKTKPEAKADDAKLDVVPEDGKYTLTMPDGIEVDQGLLDALAPKFKDLGLTHKQAQGLADEFIKHQQAQAEAHAGKPEGQWSMAAYQYFKENGTPDKWADNAKADKEIGGDKWDGTVATATRAVNALGTPELKAFLNASGGGNHPEVIRFMAKVGAMIKEDNPATGGAEGKGKPVDPAHILFANDAPKG